MKIKINDDVYLSVRWCYGEDVKINDETGEVEVYKTNETPKVSICMISFIDYSQPNPEYQMISYGVAYRVVNKTWQDEFNKKIGRKYSFARAVETLNSTFWKTLMSVYGSRIDWANNYTTKTIRTKLWDSFIEKFGKEIPPCNFKWTA